MAIKIIGFRSFKEVEAYINKKRIRKQVQGVGWSKKEKYYIKMKGYGIKRRKK